MFLVVPGALIALTALILLMIGLARILKQCDTSPNELN